MDVTPCVALLTWSPQRQCGTTRYLTPRFPPLLAPPNFVECFEDIATVFHGVVLGAVEPVRPDHGENLILVRLLPLPRVADDVAPCRSTDPLAETEDGVDVGLKMSAAVPAEDELVGVDVDMLVADTMIGPVAPPLEIGEEAVNPRQDFMRRRRIDGAQVDRQVTTILQPPVGRVAVGEEQAADGGVVPDEGVQALAVDVDDTLQPTPRRILPRLHLHRSNHENLADGAAALTATVWFVLAAEGHVGLIDLDDATKRTPVGIDHCPSELMKQKAGGLVAAEAQLRCRPCTRTTV